MIGRMELEEKYINNVNRILKNEPEYMDLFNVFMVADDKTAKTRLNYISNVVRFIHYLRNSGRPTETIDDLGKLNAEIIRKYIVDDDNRVIMENGKISDSYKYLRYFSLNCFFNFLEDGDHINKNPMRKIKTPSNERMKKKVYLDVDEVKEIEKNVSSGNTKRSKLYLSQWHERDEAIINLGFHNALRVSAIISINIDDINWEGKYLSVIEKGNKPRHVRLSDNTIKVLQEWTQKRNEYVKANDVNSSALFISSKSGRISQKTVGRILRAYAGDINKEKRIVPHTMRSSTGTNYYLKTGNARAVQQLLGQKSLAATQKYLDDTVQQRREIADAVEDLYGDD
ncbi:MAG TPA: hypothetical protein DCW90_16745 [Lachnospiraceae bacterium]|nr:hypothetical protein [Lachnospiraceae bacterium]